MVENLGDDFSDFIDTAILDFGSQTLNFGFL